jgi:2-polyprenyl-3-methyl-5-hydroxy-6-metoxy-1,4-benzoquinol methylase
MFEFHKNKKRYFEITNWVTENYLIPFIGIEDYSTLKVCEIGCGEAGVLKAFLDHGAQGVGIELSEGRVRLAKEFLSEEITLKKVEIINKNVYHVDPKTDLELKFDLIVLKDVIEHIPKQEIFIKKLQDLLKPHGSIFFAYPPWHMPFGGHQQVAASKVLNKFPWVHLLPKSIYKAILKAFGESESTVRELLEIYDTGINSEKMHSIIHEAGFEIVKEKYWLTNPIYVKKFNFKPLYSKFNIPYLRNFYCTAHYILFRKNAE